MFKQNVNIKEIIMLATIAGSTAIVAGNANAQTNNDGALEEIVVLGHIVAGERAALEAQRNAKNIANIINADGIGKLPDRNAAEAVQRIPGVSIERDQGEGRFVAVRGLPSQWNSTTLNGDRIPTAEEETTSRATAFDFFPSELIQRIEVSKALTPDMEGDAIGGNVNFVTATAPEEYLLTTSLATNYNEKSGDSGYSANVVYGDRFADDKFGFLVNATYWDRSWATDNFEPRRGSDSLGIRRLELRDYTGERTTYGFNAAGEYTPNDTTKYYVRGQFGTLIDDETHYKHRYRFDKDRVEVQNIFNELITEYRTFELGATYEFGKNKFDWKIAQAENIFKYGCIPTCSDNSYFVVRFDQGNVGYTGLENRIGSDYSYNTIDGGSDSASSPSTHLPNGFGMDPALTAFSSVELYKVDVKEKDKLVAEINFETDINPNLVIKMGAKFRDKERNAEFADEFYTWDPAAGAVPTLADFNLMNQPGRSDYDVGSSFNYSADFSQVVSRSALTRWYRQNRNNLVLDLGESALIENGAGLGRNFDVEETHSAIYGMAEWESTSNWTVVGGVRLEQTDTTVYGHVLEVNNNTNGSEVVPNKGGKDYLSVLPSIHATYEWSDDWQFRTALTRSFARPDFGDLNAGGTYAEHDNEFVSGNPELEPTYSNNLDVQVTKYFGETGHISGGLFYKDITDPIFRGVAVGAYNGVAGVELIRPENGGDAKLWGAELAFTYQFVDAPSFFQHVGVNTNVTIMDSEMDIDGRSSSNTPIPRQADLLYNLSAYYDNGIVAARLAMNYKDEYVEEFASTAALDAIYGEYTSVDFNLTWNILNSTTLFLELNNLTDEPLQYYYGTDARPKQKEYYGVRGQLGVKINF